MKEEDFRWAPSWLPRASHLPTKSTLAGRSLLCTLRLPSHGRSRDGRSRRRAWKQQLRRRGRSKPFHRGANVEEIEVARRYRVGLTSTQALLQTGANVIVVALKLSTVLLL